MFFEYVVIRIAIFYNSNLFVNFNNIFLDKLRLLPVHLYADSHPVTQIFLIFKA